MQAQQVRLVGERTRLSSIETQKREFGALAEVCGLHRPSDHPIRYHPM